MHGSLLLRPEQDELLKTLIEIDQSAPERGEFRTSRFMGSIKYKIMHLGSGGGYQIEALGGDLLALARNDYISFWPSVKDTPPDGVFDITQAGIEYVKSLSNRNQ